MLEAHTVLKQKSFHPGLQQNAVLRSLRLWVAAGFNFLPVSQDRPLLFSHFQCRNGNHLQGASPFPSPLYHAASPTHQSASVRVQGKWKGKEPGDGDSSPAGRGEERGRNRPAVPESSRARRSGACYFQCSGGWACSQAGSSNFCRLCT